MKPLIVTILISLLCVSSLSANVAKRDSTSFLCDGGMMIHTGYLTGNIEALDYQPSGAPFGVGGAAHYHFCRHWRVGVEGYVSTLHLKGNGSFIKYGWGGALLDFYWRFKRIMPYVGFTVGGGANTDLIMVEPPENEWEPAGETYYRKKGFALVDPFIGFDVILSRRIHLTFKVDCLLPLRKEHDMPIGPRFYVGILFYH